MTWSTRLPQKSPPHWHTLYWAHVLPAQRTFLTHLSNKLLIPKYFPQGLLLEKLKLRKEPLFQCPEVREPNHGDSGPRIKKWLHLNIFFNGRKVSLCSSRGKTGWLRANTQEVSPLWKGEWIFQSHVASADTEIPQRVLASIPTSLCSGRQPRAADFRVKAVTAAVLVQP